MSRPAHDIKRATLAQRAPASLYAWRELIKLIVLFAAPRRDSLSLYLSFAVALASCSCRRRHFRSLGGIKIQQLQERQAKISSSSGLNGLQSQRAEKEFQFARVGQPLSF